MKKTKTITAALAFAFCAPSMAFMPAPGIWNVEAEMTGQPGRGFNIEVENEILFFTYYGYRADGSSMFYYAAGPMSNNAFTGDLMDFKGGTAIGMPYKPATLNANLGKVTLTFTSGTHGTITLPGESAKQISKSPFGYANGPDGLLGTWQFAEVIGTSTYGLTKTLTTRLSATTYGNGTVWTSSGDFMCEYQISGGLAGMVLCATLPNTATTDTYLFKFNGDRGAGIDIFYLNTSNPLYVAANMTRIKTASGKLTGLNDETDSALSIKRSVRVAPTHDYSESGKISAIYEGGIPQEPSEPARDAAVSQWITEISNAAR